MMVRFALAIVIYSGLLASCSADKPVGPQSLDQQLTAILQTLPGAYKGEAPISVPPTGETKTLFHKFVPIDAPQFGETVLYYQLSTGSADGQALQMKIFTFETGDERLVNQMHAHVFAPGQAPGNLDLEPSRWAALDPSDLMTFPPECDLIWSQSEGGFIGEVRAADCAFTSGAFKQIIRPSMSYSIEGDRLEWNEILYSNDMRVLVTTEGALPALRQ